jgi:hypothetical protein
MATLAGPSSSGLLGSGCSTSPLCRRSRPSLVSRATGPTCFSPCGPSHLSHPYYAQELDRSHLRPPWPSPPSTDIGLRLAAAIPSPLSSPDRSGVPPPLGPCQAYAPFLGEHLGEDLIVVETLSHRRRGDGSTRCTPGAHRRCAGAARHLGQPGHDGPHGPGQWPLCSCMDRLGRKAMIRPMKRWGV